MKRVGVSITALFSNVGLSPWFRPLPCMVSPFPVAFPLASSTLIDLPMCYYPLRAKALSKDDLRLNLTKAIPLGFPSGLINKLMLMIYPHDSNISLTSLS